MIKPSIPEEDKKLIEDAFSSKPKDQVIIKDRRGNKITTQKGIVDSNGFIIRDYTGRILKHNKSRITREGIQVTIGRKGQKYEDIAKEQRDQLSWSDSDFVN